MSFVRPSFSQAFLNRFRSCSADSLPRSLTLIMRRSSFRGPSGWGWMWLCETKPPARFGRRALTLGAREGVFPAVSAFPGPRHRLGYGMSAPARTGPDAAASGVETEGPLEDTIRLRVRYTEVDAMGYLHHSRFLQYFEMGRVELLRSLGHAYADLERGGIFFVVAKAEVRYKAPARYDEELHLTTRVVRQTHVRIDHAYERRS